MHLIGINGFKGSGKNTSAELLDNIYGDGEGVVYQVGFADKVKILGARALGFVDLPPRECIALMDQAKERWLFDITATTGDLLSDFPFHNLTGREYLQHIGTEARKLFGDDFWVDQVLPQPAHGARVIKNPRDVKGSVQYRTEAEYNEVALEMRYPDVDCVAITDLRFPNEAQRVLDLGGVVWRINRPGTESDGHDSEQVLPDELVTHEILNVGDLRRLEAEVEKAMNETLR